MKSKKALLIAIAAFAVTATGVQAYVGNEQLNKAGFSEQQIQALVQARELKSQGEIDKARDVLLKAGFDEEKVANLREVIKKAHNKGKHKHKHRGWVEGLTPEQGDALRAARQANDHVTVKEILREAGIINSYEKHNHERY